MKHLYLACFLLAGGLIMTHCGTAKKITTPVKSTYESHLQSVIAANCTPCHIPSKGGKKKDYSNFTAVQSDIDEMIKRIEMQPGEKGFMPFRSPRLPDSTIAVFKQWKTDGMLEK